MGLLRDQISPKREIARDYLWTTLAVPNSCYNGPQLIARPALTAARFELCSPQATSRILETGPHLGSRQSFAQQNLRKRSRTDPPRTTQLLTNAAETTETLPRHATRVKKGSGTVRVRVRNSRIGRIATPVRVQPTAAAAQTLPRQYANTPPLTTTVLVHSPYHPLYDSTPHHRTSPYPKLPSPFRDMYPLPCMCSRVECITTSTFVFVPALPILCTCTRIHTYPCTR